MTFPPFLPKYVKQLGLTNDSNVFPKKKTWTLFPPEGQERKYPRSRFGTSGRTVGISRNRRATFRHFVEIGILYTSFFQVSCPPQLGKKKGNSVFGSPLKRRFFQFYSAFSSPGSDRNLSKLEIKTAARSVKKIKSLHKISELPLLAKLFYEYWQFATG